MSSETKRERNLIVAIPIVSIIFIIIYLLFVRLIIGPTSHQERDLWSTDFVPGESPYATGEHAR